MRSFWAALLGALASRTGLLILGVMLLAILMLSLPQPNILVSASLRTESLDITVRNAEAMQLHLPRADMGGQCLENVTVRVAPGGRIALSKPAGPSLYIATEGQTDWDSDTAGAANAPAGEYFLVSAEGECAWAGDLRLPVVGELSAGAVAAAAADPEGFLPLINGDLTVYGRAVSRILWIIPLDIIPILPLEPEKLYVADIFPVPPGSQIEGGDARFWGFVDVGVGAGDEQGMRLEASTNARDLRIFAPAPRVSGDAGAADALEPDRISLTFGARLANDPNLHIIFGLFTVIASLIGLSGNLIKPPKRKNPVVEDRAP